MQKMFTTENTEKRKNTICEFCSRNGTTFTYTVENNSVRLRLVQHTFEAIVETSASVSTTPAASRSFQLASLAPIIFVLLWSTGFIASKYGLPYAEPFTYLSLRMLIAGGLLLGISVLTRASWPKTPIQFFHIA